MNDYKNIRDVVSDMMTTQLLLIGWNNRLQKKLLKHWTGQAEADLFREFPANRMPVLWSNDHTSKHPSDNRATKGFEAFINAVCDQMTAEHPDYAPMQIDPRQIRPLWKKPLQDTLNLLTRHASNNRSLKV